MAKTQTPLVDNQVAALWKVGFIGPIDVAYLAFTATATFTFFVWCLAQHSVSLAAYIVYFSLMNISTLMWIVILCFRCCMFSLKTRANLEMLPEQAAAVLHKYLQGGAPNEGSNL